MQPWPPTCARLRPSTSSKTSPPLTGMVEHTILGSIVLHCQRTEEGFLGTQDLNSRSRVIGTFHWRAGIGDHTGANQLGNKNSHVRSNREHTSREIFVQLCTVRGKFNSLNNEENGDDKRNHTKKFPIVYGNTCSQRWLIQTTSPSATSTPIEISLLHFITYYFS